MRHLESGSADERARTCHQRADEPRRTSGGRVASAEARLPATAAGVGTRAGAVQRAAATVAEGPAAPRVVRSTRARNACAARAPFADLPGATSAEDSPAATVGLDAAPTGEVRAGLPCAAGAIALAYRAAGARAVAAHRCAAAVVTHAAEVTARNRAAARIVGGVAGLSSAAATAVDGATASVGDGAALRWRACAGDARAEWRARITASAVGAAHLPRRTRAAVDNDAAAVYGRANARKLPALATRLGTLGRP